MIREVIEFLLDNGAAENVHSGRDLIDHLLGTAELLTQWECDKDIVLAGLCHSVYGTDSYRTVTVDPSRRDEVRILIGERAEQLAWEFGNRKNPRIVSFIKNNEIDLVVIECANLIEQQVNPCFLAVATVIQLPDNVRNAVNDYLRA
jgi:(p)ppGpp synthase/HD superfamily hydrolase